MAWGECPSCGSYMNVIVISDYTEDYEAESCPDPECDYHLKEDV
jgi:hypothetical protein